jgi:NAD(P)-dependent dehydrogenase (short-subunit alcohol dehydrogenase family)
MAAGISEKYLEAIRKSAALERNGRPEEIAQVVCGLCMCSYITGEIIRVDGGTRFPHL